jgi:uncharacterized membrane protein
MYLEVLKLLKCYNVSLSKNFLKTKLETHPYYPSVLAIKDTLEELGISVNVFKIDIHNFKQIDSCFLAHTKSKTAEDIIFIESSTALTKNQHLNTDYKFTGIVLTIEISEKINKITENEEALKKELKTNLFKIITIISILGLGITGLFKNDFHLINPLLLLTNLLGFVLSVFIIQKELGIANSVSAVICGLSKKPGCETILQSNSSKVFSWLTWGDVGLTFFSSSVFFLFLSILTTNIPVSPIIVLAIASIMFPFYSLYYQLKVFKQLCMLCIGVLAIQFINFSICLYYLRSIPTSLFSTFDLYSLFVFIFLALLFLFSWLLIKPVILKTIKSDLYYTLFKRTKRNPAIFLSLLNKKPTIEDCLLLPNETISFGEALAPYNILMACNPFCNPCSLAHEAIHRIHNKYPGQLRIGIRFILNKKDIDTNDERVQVVRYILEYIKQNPRMTEEILHAWYSLESLERLKIKFPCTNLINVENELMDLVAWDSKMAIRGTPTFWMNGKEVSGLFSWTDLIEQLPIIIEDNMETTTQKP